MPRPERDPRALGDLLATLAARRGWHERMAVGALRDAWADVVGPLVAARSEPVALRGGVLTVRAEGGAWATELTLLGASLAAKADAFLEGSARVERVRITAGSAGSSGGRPMG